MNARIRAHLQRRAAQHRRFVEKVKTDNGCQDCGARENLTFDHRVRADKHFCVTSRLRTSHANWLRELLKCDLVCRLCRDVREQVRDRQARRKASSPPGRRRAR